MSDVTIWHNPRCSKSRQTLALLEENGISLSILTYLNEAPSRAEIEKVFALLALDSPADMMRVNDQAFKEAGLTKDSTAQALLAVMAENSALIERPIVIANGKARIGRPPESVLEIL